LRIAVGCGPPIIDPDIAALRPPELLEPLQERGDADLSFPVALGIPHHHADAPHPLGLLRARRERPCDDRAANKRDEFASFHRITSRQARRS
jgi:hypothetical protein